MYSASTHTRRDRTFIGGDCAACEESLELTLHGERIIQLMCGHVSHEACFYEYIKEFEAHTCPSCEAPLSLDTSRGGASIDFQNLNRLVRSLQMPRDMDDHSIKQPPISLPRAIEFSNRVSQARATDRSIPQQREQASPTKIIQMSTSPVQTREQHGRGDISPPVSADKSTDARRRNFDVNEMESATTSTNEAFRHAIPPPSVIVRSEFPTITKSRQRQSLTCLVTVEVPQSPWQTKLSVNSSCLPSTPEVLSPKLKLPLSPLGKPVSPVDSVYGDISELDRVRDELFDRMDHWHGMEHAKFGSLIQYGRMRVGKDGKSWQDLDCYLFTEMLICVKERKLIPDSTQEWNGSDISMSKPRYALKGSILINKHLRHVDVSPESSVLTLNLSVVELPKFHLQFASRRKLEKWHAVLNKVSRCRMLAISEAASEQDAPRAKRDSSDDVNAVHQVSKDMSPSPYTPTSAEGSAKTLSNEYSSFSKHTLDWHLQRNSPHIPLDIVVVVPLFASMQGLKCDLLRDALQFLISNLGEHDRMGLVTFGSGDECVPFVGMTTKSWSGWSKALGSIRSTLHECVGTNAVEGTKIALDMLMQRKSFNPVTSILLFSDSPGMDHESNESIISRAESAKIQIHTFGLGLTHHPDTLVTLSTRTHASYTYVKDWMMLRECLAGCLGSLQSSSHQNVKLKIRLPSASTAQFVKISGGRGTNKRASGRDVEVVLGDLRFGEKRDILVQLAILPTTSSLDLVQMDAWSNVVAGLEALGEGQNHSRAPSVEEVPLLQADLVWDDLLSAGKHDKLSQPSLLTIAALTAPSPKITDSRLSIPAGPAHPSIIQRRMELLSSDMLSRALLLVSQGKHDRAQHLLAETRSILRGLAKGSLPPLPPPPGTALPPTPPPGPDCKPSAYGTIPASELPRTPSPASSEFRSSGTPGVDVRTLLALDHELGTSMEWIAHPTIFERDSRKAVLQAIGMISNQRAFTLRTPAESIWAARIPGVRRMTEASGEWRET